MESVEEMFATLPNKVCTAITSTSCASIKPVSAPVPKKRKKPSVTSSWAYNAINNLIQAVEAHPCIWQYSSSDYKDRSKREQAWREIEEECPEHTVDDCKAKWANVKTAFQNVKNKMKTKSGQGIENTQPHWPHWNAMQFFNRHDLTKSTISVSTLDAEDSQPGCSTSLTSSTLEKEKLNQTYIMQRAIKYLETEEDNWHTIGMYLASQMREIAKTNRKAANKLHMKLVKSAMEASLEADDGN